MYKRRNRTRLLTPAQEKPNKHGLNIASNEVNYYNNLKIDQEDDLIKWVEQFPHLG